MMPPGLGKRRGAGGFEPPIELRFVDLFMLIVTALMFTTVVLILLSASMGGGERVEPPKVLTEAVPKALVGVPYQLMLAASGGSGGYVWNLTEESLPEPLKLKSEGLIYGTPQEGRRIQFRVTVADSKGRSSSPVLLELEIISHEGMQRDTVAAIQVTAPTVLLPDAKGREPYEVPLTAHGGVPPYSWQTSRGTPPVGLKLSSQGVLSGTPSQWNAPSSFTVQVSDAWGQSIEQEVKLWVLAPPLSLWQQVLLWAALGSLLLPLLFGGPGLLTTLIDIGRWLGRWLGLRR